MTAQFMIYGATGYTGKLIAHMAKEQGLHPLLAGRNGDALKMLADALGFEYRVLRLQEEAPLLEALREVRVVLNIAGPFAAIAQPLIEACLQTGVHYLDVTGELDVFSDLARRDAAAKAARIMLMPGVGHVIVPSDCLAASVTQRLPEAQNLYLAISRPEFISRGSIKTMISLMSDQVYVRRNGRLTTVPAGTLQRAFDFGQGERTGTAVSWPDVFTAFYTTGTPNITVYSETNFVEQILYALGGRLTGLLHDTPWQAFLSAQAELLPEGPSAEARRSVTRTIVAEAVDRLGRKVCARLRTPEAYTFTGMTALAIIERVLAGEVLNGFQTPARVYGADFVLCLPNVVREDLTQL